MMMYLLVERSEVLTLRNRRPADLCKRAEYCPVLNDGLYGLTSLRICLQQHYRPYQRTGGPASILGGREKASVGVRWLCIMGMSRSHILAFAQTRSLQTEAHGHSQLLLGNPTMYAVLNLTILE